MWFRRDLRLADNHALAAALADARDGGGGVIPLFVVDDRLWKPAGANRRWFLAGCLAALARRPRRPPRRAPRRPRRRHRASSPASTTSARVHRAQDVGIYGAGPRRGRRRRRWPPTAVSSSSPTARGRSRPGTLRTGVGRRRSRCTPPYLRAWRQHRLAGDGRGGRRTSRRSTGCARTACRRHRRSAADLPEPGEAAAHRALDRFLASRLDDYAATRNDPGADATSRLSPYLKWGCLHPRQLLRRLDGRNRPHDTFAKELAWRDFYADVLDALARVGVAVVEPADGRHARRRRARAADERFDGVVRGTHRLPDRRRRHAPARRRGLDAQPGADDHGELPRQGPPRRLDPRRPVLPGAPRRRRPRRRTTTAGSGSPAPGTDAAPYFRIFNPTTQGQKFDPDGVVRAPLGARAGRPRRRRTCTSRGRRPAARRAGYPAADRRPRRRARGIAARYADRPPLTPLELSGSANLGVVNAAATLRDARRRAGLTRSSWPGASASPRACSARTTHGRRQPGADVFLDLVRAAGFEPTWTPPPRRPPAGSPAGRGPRARRGPAAPAPTDAAGPPVGLMPTLVEKVVALSIAAHQPATSPTPSAARWPWRTPPRSHAGTRDVDVNLFVAARRGRADVPGLADGRALVGRRRRRRAARRAGAPVVGRHARRPVLRRPRDPPRRRPPGPPRRLRRPADPGPRPGRPGACSRCCSTGPRTGPTSRRCSTAAPSTSTRSSISSSTCWATTPAVGSRRGSLRGAWRASFDATSDCVRRASLRASGRSGSVSRWSPIRGARPARPRQRLGGRARRAARRTGVLGGVDVLPGRGDGALDALVGADDRQRLVPLGHVRAAGRAASASSSPTPPPIASVRSTGQRVDALDHVVAGRLAELLGRWR